MSQFTDCLYGECPSCRAAFGAPRRLEQNRDGLLYCPAMDCPTGGETFTFEEIDAQDASIDPLATMREQLGVSASEPVEIDE